MTQNSRFARNNSRNKLERVDVLLEQALDLSPAERKELLETLLFFDMVMSDPPDIDQID